MSTEAVGNQQLIKVVTCMTPVRRLHSTPGLPRADLALSVDLTESSVGLLFL